MDRVTLVAARQDNPAAPPDESTNGAAAAPDTPAFVVVLAGALENGVGQLPARQPVADPMASQKAQPAPARTPADVSVAPLIDRRTVRREAATVAARPPDRSQGDRAEQSEAEEGLPAGIAAKRAKGKTHATALGPSELGAGNTTIASAVHVALTPVAVGLPVSCGPEWAMSHVTGEHKSNDCHAALRCGGRVPCLSLHIGSLRPKDLFPVVHKQAIASEPETGQTATSNPEGILIPGAIMPPPAQLVTAVSIELTPGAMSPITPRSQVGPASSGGNEPAVPAGELPPPDSQTGSPAPPRGSHTPAPVPDNRAPVVGMPATGTGATIRVAAAGQQQVPGMAGGAARTGAGGSAGQISQPAIGPMAGGDDVPVAAVLAESAPRAPSRGPDLYSHASGSAAALAGGEASISYVGMAPAAVVSAHKPGTTRSQADSPDGPVYDGMAVPFAATQATGSAPPAGHIVEAHESNSAVMAAGPEAGVPAAGAATPASAPSPLPDRASRERGLPVAVAWHGAMDSAGAPAAASTSPLHPSGAAGREASEATGLNGAGEAALAHDVVVPVAALARWEGARWPPAGDELAISADAAWATAALSYRLVSAWHSTGTTAAEAGATGTVPTGATVAANALPPGPRTIPFRNGSPVAVADGQGSSAHREMSPASAPSAGRSTASTGGAALAANVSSLGPGGSHPSSHLSATPAGELAMIPDGIVAEAGATPARRPDTAHRAVEAAEHAAGPAPQPGELPAYTGGTAPSAPVTADLSPGDGARSAGVRDAAAETLPDVETMGRTLAERLVRAIRQDQGECHLELHPRELGQVVAHLELAGSRLNLHLSASSDQAQHIIGDSLPALREALQSHGIALGQCDVGTSGDGRGAGGWRAPPQPHPPVRVGMALPSRGREARIASTPGRRSGILDIEI